MLELFKAADKYDVAGLVKECMQIFRKITHSADVAPLLQVSCPHPTCYFLAPIKAVSAIQVLCVLLMWCFVWKLLCALLTPVLLKSHALCSV